MDIYQIIITYYPIWSLFEWIIFLSVLALAVCIAVVLYKKQKITMRQSIAGILLLLYLLLVFGSTVFTRMPGERQYQLEVFWSWKKILHYIEQHGMVTGTGLLRENLLNIVMLFPEECYFHLCLATEAKSGGGMVCCLVFSFPDVSKGYS